MPLLIIIPLAAAVAAGYFLGRSGVKPEEEAPEVIDAAKDWTGKASETAKDWLEVGKAHQSRLTGRAKNWLGAGKPHEVPDPEQFVAWLAQLPRLGKAFKAWVENLAPPEAGALADGAAGFTSSLGVELTWLMEGQTDDTPELKKGMEEAVVFFCEACWKASLVQDDAAAFLLFQSWQENPDRHAELTQQLYAKLVRAEAVSMPPELSLAPEEERKSYVVQAIRDFAAKDRTTFNTILKDTLKDTVAAPVTAQETETGQTQPDSGDESAPVTESAEATTS